MSNHAKIEALNKEKAETEIELRQLKNRQKVLLNNESEIMRKARTRRLIQRGGMLESAFPMALGISDDALLDVLFQISRLPER